MFNRYVQLKDSLNFFILHGIKFLRRDKIILKLLGIDTFQNYGSMNFSRLGDISYGNFLIPAHFIVNLDT